MSDDQSFDVVNNKEILMGDTFIRVVVYYNARRKCDFHGPHSWKIVDKNNSFECMHISWFSGQTSFTLKLQFTGFHV